MMGGGWWMEDELYPSPPQAVWPTTTPSSITRMYAVLCAGVPGTCMAYMDTPKYACLDAVDISRASIGLGTQHMLAQPSTLYSEASTSLTVTGYLQGEGLETGLVSTL